MQRHITIAAVDIEARGVGDNGFAVDVDGAAFGAEGLRAASLEENIAAHHHRGATQHVGLTGFAKRQRAPFGVDATAFKVNDPVTTFVGVGPKCGLQRGGRGTDAGIGAQLDVPLRLHIECAGRGRYVSERGIQEHIVCEGLDADRAAGRYRGARNFNSTTVLGAEAAAVVLCPGGDDTPAAQGGAGSRDVQLRQGFAKSDRVADADRPRTGIQIQTRRCQIGLEHILIKGRAGARQIVPFAL